MNDGLREKLILWSNFITNIRNFFVQAGYLEVQTPKLQPFAAVEAHIDSITAYPYGQNTVPHYLICSPEYAMKKLLSQGSGSIFEITCVFRAAEDGRWHKPEFTMLEWYHLGWDEHTLILECKKLFEYFLGTQNFQKISYRTTFINHLGLDPFSFDHNLWFDRLRHQPLWDEPFAMKQLEQGWDDFLDYVFATCIQGQLGQQGLECVYDFPKTQAPFSKWNKDGLTGCRFEFFYRGVELVNGYFELNDPQEQEKRLLAVNHHRKKNGKTALSLDPAFITSLANLPDCAGAAMGLERLFCLSHNFPNIHWQA